ncbi:Hypothetical Protein RRSL_02409 [Ralstonia solanacearum UW551]|uniref:Uncharacterized protein n=5 Tax=Ralstonia TaxID=48736 RepID=A0AB33VFF4_RALSU|nr:hypothetical protein CCY86_05240 [Ralstonia solanacearum]EAP72770.1 Hypothetical Protein RRSL_02409 [Ralstonia solanacearum UW551]KFZ93207.2 hypothetical protein CR47_0216115 [Ralstonia solanacearum]PNQ50303.1 hypothetical protein CVV70_07290 [Ralstonia solanacearum]
MLILAIATIASAPAMAKGPISPEVFRDSYNAHAKDLLPALQTTQCRTISAAKEPGKAILECQTVANNTLLSINGMNKRFDGAWLMLDASALPHPSDLTRAGGLLLRVAKGYHYGNHLALAQEAIIGAQRSKGKQSCIDDPASGSRLCVSTDNGTIYNMILEQAEPKKG